MDKQAQDEFDKEMRDYLRVSAGNFDFWDKDPDDYDHEAEAELHASYSCDVDTPVVPASSLEALCDDYWAMRWAGDLGGTEAEALKK